MDLTTFLAHLWGPTILAIGLGIFVSPSHYIKIYRDFEKETLTVLFFGIFATVFGIMQILFHNVWNTLAQIVISILGWGMFVKGLLFLIAPHFVDKVGNFWTNKKLVPCAGVLMLVIGAYLTWFAYFA